MKVVNNSASPQSVNYMDVPVGGVFTFAEHTYYKLYSGYVAFINDSFTPLPSNYDSNKPGAAFYVGDNRQYRIRIKPNAHVVID